jgi:transcriptional regulator with XRE-family HTH domain
MEDLNQRVAQNLKLLRDERKLSLERLSELTGVSKSMLGQIERGDSSPTIATVWKISSGLKVSFTALLDAPRADTHIVYKAQIQPLVEDNGRYRLYPQFPIDAGRRFEIYLIEIEKGGCLSAEAHPQGTHEFLTVFQGELNLQVDEQEYHVAEGDAIQFRADRPHAYHNPGETLTRISLTIHYT